MSLTIVQPNKLVLKLETGQGPAGPSTLQAQAAAAQAGQSRQEAAALAEAAESFALQAQQQATLAGQNAQQAALDTQQLILNHEGAEHPHGVYLRQQDADQLYRIELSNNAGLLTNALRSLTFLGNVVVDVVGDDVTITVLGGGGGAGGVAGVSSFNNRSGDVLPQLGDYNQFFLTPQEGNDAYALIDHMHPEYLDGVSIFDEETLLGKAIALKFAGSAVSAQLVGGVATITIAAGSSDLAAFAAQVAALVAQPAEQGDFNVSLRGTEIVKVLSTDSEVVLARLHYESLSERLRLAHRFLGPTFTIPASGRYCDNMYSATNATASQAFSANRFSGVPYWTPERFRIDRIGIVVLTAIAGLSRISIYGVSMGSVLPATRLFSGALELDSSTAGAKEHVLDFVFEPETLYWLVINSNVTGGAYRAGPNAGALSFGAGTVDATTYRTGIARTGFPATDPMPETVSFTDSDVIAVGNQVPLFRMRVAPL